MSQALRVFVNTTAPPAISGWFDSMLAPAIHACRFASEPPPVEVRSRMQPAGRIRRDDEDGRVVLAGRATLWTRFTLTSVYLHEVAHALCHALPGTEKTGPHGPVFCLVLSCLYRRAAVVPHLSQLPDSVSFYDFTDCPADLDGVVDWRAEVVRFLTAESSRLANSPCNAEALAAGALEAWQTFVSGRFAAEQARTAELARQRLLNRRLIKLSARLRTSYRSNAGWVVCAVVGWCFAIFNGAACQLK